MNVADTGHAGGDIRIAAQALPVLSVGCYFGCFWVLECFSGLSYCLRMCVW